MSLSFRAHRPRGSCALVASELLLVLGCGFGAGAHRVATVATVASGDERELTAAEPRRRRRFLCQVGAPSELGAGPLASALPGRLGRTMRASMSSSSCLPFSTRVPIWLLRVFTSLDSTLFRDRRPSDFFFRSSSSLWRASRSPASFWKQKVRSRVAGRCGTSATTGPSLPLTGETHDRKGTCLRPQSMSVEPGP